MNPTTNLGTPRRRRDSTAGGFLVWIAVYAVFMIALIAFNGTTQSLGLSNAHWHATTAAR
jgi:hypothetical protein